LVGQSVSIALRIADANGTVLEASPSFTTSDYQYWYHYDYPYTCNSDTATYRDCFGQKYSYSYREGAASGVTNPE
jgi:hypothetical protein